VFSAASLPPPIFASGTVHHNTKKRPTMLTRLLSAALASALFLLTGSARGRKATWQQIISSYPKTFLTGVNGDE
jgi:hypothetical protein